MTGPPDVAFEARAHEAIDHINGLHNGFKTEIDQWTADRRAERNHMVANLLVQIVQAESAPLAMDTQTTVQSVAEAEAQLDEQWAAAGLSPWEGPRLSTDDAENGNFRSDNI